MMTGKNDDAARTLEDSFLGQLVPQVAEHLAARHAGDFDAEAGRARFMTWLAAHTEEPATPARGRAGGEKASRRPRHRRLSRSWSTVAGVLAGVSAIAAVVIVVGSSPLLIFLVGVLLGVLAGGALCAHYLRSEIAADIGPQLRRMQNQLDLMESAVNLDLASRYAELGQLPWTPPVSPRSIPGQPEQ
jgi:hypothetical protein